MDKSVPITLVTLCLAATALADDLISAVSKRADKLADYGIVRGRTAFAAPAAAPLAVDGKLDEAMYGQPPTFADFSFFGASADKPRLPDGKTLGWAAFDADNLYFGFRCFETALNKLRTVCAKADDGAVWEDDEVEIFLDPTLSGADYYQLMVNAAGTLCDFRLRATYNLPGGILNAIFSADVAWNSGAKVAVGREANAWTMEIAIPWKAFGMARGAPGYSCGLNLTRHRIPVEENTGWTRLDGLGGNHNPRRFGLLVCGSDAPYISLIPPVDFFPGPAAMHLTLRNPSSREARISGKAEGVSGEIALPLPAGQEGTLAIPYTVSGTATSAAVAIEVRNNGAPFFTGRYTGPVADLLRISVPRKDIVVSKKTEKVLAEIGLSAEARAVSALRLELLDGAGKAVRSGDLRPIPARFLELTLNVGGLKVGRYTLRGALLGADGKPLLTADSALNLITDPLDF